MTYLNDEVLDGGLDYVTANGSRLDICSQEPTTYAEATSTFSLGNKTSLSVGNPENGASSGRRVIVAAITDGSVTDDGTAAFWAITDASSVLIAANSLSSSQAVTSSNTFTLDAFSITIPDPA